MVSMPPPAGELRYFLNCSGRRLPLDLVGPLEAPQLNCVRGWFDAQGRVCGFDRLVAGEVELAHRYSYRPGGELAEARILMAGEDEEVVLEYAPAPEREPALA